MTTRGVQQILVRLEEKDFIRRQIGGGRGNVTAYQIVGIDVLKGEPQTANSHSVNVDSVNETLHSHAVNPAQPCNAIRNEPVLEPNGETPPDLEPLQYADGLLERIQLPKAFKNKMAVTHSIEILEKSGRSRLASFEFLQAQALDAIARGERVDAFWFDDGKWRGNGKPNRTNTVQVERYNNNLAAMLRGRAAAAGRGAGVGNNSVPDGAGQTPRIGAGDDRVVLEGEITRTPR
jgi:hypothetical protein